MRTFANEFSRERSPNIKKRREVDKKHNDQVFKRRGDYDFLK